MNDDLFMNDTLDNINFTQDLLAKNKSLSPFSGSYNQKSNGVGDKDEISFDDSIFLSTSLENNLSTEKENNLTDFNRVSEINKPRKTEDVSSNKSNEVVPQDIAPSFYRLPDSTVCTGNKKDTKRRCNSMEGKTNETIQFADLQLIKNNRECVNIKSSQVINCKNKNETSLIDSCQLGCELSSWCLPNDILKKYKDKGLYKMFQWQVECLNRKDVIEHCRNLVYAAPTSAGKTLVAEILALKTLLERKRKVIFILPFVSIVQEKMYYFQNLLGSSGVRVEGFMGSYNPPGGFSSVHMAICTIEKANSLINRLLEEKKLSDVGAILVDEIHMLGDPSRGYLLELLLTKLNYVLKRNENIKLQIIGMSATLPNLDHLAKWLDAEFYVTDFRPIPLYEQAHVCGEIYDKNLKLIRKLIPLDEVDTDTDNILQLCLETIKESCSVLIFCPTKSWCENLAQQISTSFCKLGNGKNQWSELLRSQLKTNLIMEVLEQLKYCPVGLDDMLRKTVSFGVAFHHAGLTMDEREIIEGAFRSGALRILVATSTLSSGVNLPARRVIVRTPIFHGKPIDVLSYRQMIGRAGRMGKDSVGESFLICQKNDQRIARTLMSAELRPVESCLEGAGKLKRAILEVIASGVASSPEDVDLFAKCTLLAVMNEDEERLENPIDEAVTFLRDNEFIRLQKLDDGTEKFIATSLGKACLSSSVAPDEGLALFTELEKARQCFVLETELHLVYLVTPYSACHSWGTIDWMFYLELWQKLPKSMKKVGELVGVRESYLIGATRGKIQTDTNKSYHKLLIHKRFFVALALQDLVNEKPLSLVCAKFNCNRGLLQSLQQSASVFAGMVTAFSRQLGWSSVELLISQFQDRMQFGVSRDLLDLMHLSILNGKIARTLYNAGIETVSQLANSKITDVEDILYKSVPFETQKEKEGESEYAKRQRNKFRNVWVTGKEGLTEREAAEMLVNEARKYLKLEMGLVDAKWENAASVEEGLKSDSKEDNYRKSHGKDGIVKALDSSTVPEIKGKSENLEKVSLPKENMYSNLLFETENNMSNSSDDLFEATPNVVNNASVIHNSNEQSCHASDAVEMKNYETLSSNGGCIIETDAFSDLDFSNVLKIEKLAISSKQKEVSDILTSLPSQELNISSSSSSSPNSKVNVSFEKMSDNSTFGGSFSLHLSSDTSVDSGIKEENVRKEMDTADLLEIAFSGSFQDNNSDILENSDNEFEITRKRKNGSFVTDSPNKKHKIQDTRLSVSSVEDKFDDDNPVDLNKIEIVNVSQDSTLFNLFSRDFKQQNQLALSLACSKFEHNKPCIGLGMTTSKATINHETAFVVKNTKLNGVAVTWNDNTVYYISFESQEFSQKVIRLLKSFLENENVKVKLFDSKEQIKILKHCFTEIRIMATIDDPKVADWILDHEGKEKNLLAMMVKYFPEGVKLAQLAGNCKGLGSIGLDLHSLVDPKVRSSIEAVLTWHLVDLLKIFLKEISPAYMDVYYLETQCVRCLSKMETTGISVKKELLQQLEETLKAQLTAIETKAYSLAGRRFNFVSSTDVAKAIGMFKGRKVSTRKQILGQNEHPISELVLLWRKINCTLTKTIYPLIRATEADRIHGCYITHTATGRISMHEPNLQNIAKDFDIVNPLRQENVLISCRRAFAVSEDSWLISADYCQLELRILTHLSQDKLLCTIMNNPGDVFRSIAAKWNNVDIDEVNDAMRHRTKNLCYAIIYGMGAKSLSEQLQIDEDDAATFMETFKNTYPALKTFIKDTINNCRAKGYVETIFGRRRYLPNVNDTDAIKRGQAERQAVNTVVQGSAADIAKRAMVMVETELHKVFCKSRNSPKLVLHLHDELMYEVPLKYVRKVAKIVKKYMEESVQLSVPFPVKLKAGQSWGEMTEFTL